MHATGTLWLVLSSGAFADHLPCNGSSANLAIADCNAWQDLYDAALTWTDCNNRLDPCAWDRCQTGCIDGRIESINLGGTGLYGTIPDSLGDLSQLTFLDMYRGSARGLSGTIPDSVGNCRS